MFGVMLLAFSISIDALGIGLSYGMKKVRLTILSYIIVFCMSFLFMGISVFFGSQIIKVIPSDYAKIIGGTLVLLMGIWTIYQVFRTESKKKEKKETHSHKDEKVLMNLLLNSFGITIQIIRNPISCDLDNSNTIDPLESIYLGAALSIDSIGIGIISASLGLTISMIPVTVAVFQLLFLYLGVKSGAKLADDVSNNKLWRIISGIILIIIGIMRML